MKPDDLKEIPNTVPLKAHVGIVHFSSETSMDSYGKKCWMDSIYGQDDEEQEVR